MTTMNALLGCALDLAEVESALLSAYAEVFAVELAEIECVDLQARIAAVK